MIYLVWLLFLLFGCQQDEITFKTFRPRQSPKMEIAPFFANTAKTETKEVKKEEKKCPGGCKDGTKCVDGVCTKEAATEKRETLSDLIKRGESVGFIPGVTHVDYGGEDRFSPEGY